MPKPNKNEEYSNFDIDMSEEIREDVGRTEVESNGITFNIVRESDMNDYQNFRDSMMPNIGGKDQLRDFLVEDEKTGCELLFQGSLTLSKWSPLTLILLLCKKLAILTGQYDSPTNSR